MSSTVGEEDARSLLSSRDMEQHHSTIAKLLQRELDASRAEVTLLHQHGHQQTELLRRQQSQAAVGGTTHTRRPEILKVDIFKYKGVEEDFLLFWFVELDRAIKARRIDDEQKKLRFAQANLAGRAKTWVLGLEMSDPYAFGSLEAFKTQTDV